MTIILSVAGIIVIVAVVIIISKKKKASQQIIEKALTPGEAIPKGYGLESPTPSALIKEPLEKPATAEGTDTWLCDCGKENNTDFCISCGKTKVSIVSLGKKFFCGNCGREQKQDAKFCMKCGKRL